MREVQRLFRQEHDGHYKIYSLCSESDYPDSKFDLIARYPFDERSPPPFDIIIPFCKDVHAFLEASPNNVVAVHCKSGKGRTGTMIACYLLYSQNCITSSQALRLFDTKRCVDRVGVTIPSQRRYVGYVEQLLKRMNYDIKADIMSSFPSSMFKLNFICLSCQPKGKSKMFVCIKHRGKSIFYVRDSEQKSDLLKFLCRGLILQDDIQIVFFNRTTRTPLFWFYLNTNFLTNNFSMGKQDIDNACKDVKHKIYPVNFRVSVDIERINSPSESNSRSPSLDIVPKDSKESKYSSAKPSTSPTSPSPPSPLSNMDLCGECNKPILAMDVSLTVKGKLFHWFCLTCNSCSGPLFDKNEVIVNMAMPSSHDSDGDRLLCSKCETSILATCSICKVVLTGNTTTNIPGIGCICSNCFSCSLCGKKLLHKLDDEYNTDSDVWDLIGDQIVCKFHTREEKQRVSHVNHAQPISSTTIREIEFDDDDDDDMSILSSGYNTPFLTPRGGPQPEEEDYRTKLFDRSSYYPDDDESFVGDESEMEPNKPSSNSSPSTKPTTLSSPTHLRSPMPLSPRKNPSPPSPSPSPPTPTPTPPPPPTTSTPQSTSTTNEPKSPTTESTNRTSPSPSSVSTVAVPELNRVKAQQPNRRSLERSKTDTEVQDNGIYVPRKSREGLIPSFLKKSPSTTSKPPQKYNLLSLQRNNVPKINRQRSQTFQIQFRTDEDMEVPERDRLDTSPKYNSGRSHLISSAGDSRYPKIREKSWSAFNTDDEDDDALTRGNVSLFPSKDPPGSISSNNSSLPASQSSSSTYSLSPSPTSSSLQSSLSSPSISPPQPTSPPSSMSFTIPKNAKICNTCQQPIEVKMFLSLGNGMYFHYQHYTCSSCQILLRETDQVSIIDKKLFCVDCALASTLPKCFKCQDYIEGSMLTHNNHNYHERCFSCCYCNVNLGSSQFYFLDNRAICFPCGDKILYNVK
eukprot:TRINITY_DN3359_c0_g1_i5.p1 TRINITY_DN3359_c0_g1~~TRINITY_DN3359_c0_g1_i5.p1  ORF type:complete len:1018 (+),score=221.86 TRINITY_DN3359_c0_g1_i5:161-3055(+)